MSTASRFRDYIHGKRLFILGSGFSAAAGVPMTNSLLQLCIRRFKRDCPGIFSRLESYAQIFFGYRSRKPNFGKIPFTDLCTFLEYVELREWAGGERWNDSGCREKLALKYFLSKTIVELTPEGGELPSLYVKFAQQLTERDVVITFNWDCLLEHCLEHVGRRYSYEFAADKLNLVKMHGSINWRLPIPDCEKRLSFNWQALNWGSAMSPQLYASSELLSKRRWCQDNGPLGEVEPFLVLPGMAKARELRCVGALWYKPEATFGFTGDVFIIGLSLSEDDIFIRSYFLNTLPYLRKFKRLLVINPDPKVRANYQFVLDRKNTTFLCEKFGHRHLKLMASARTASSPSLQQPSR